MNEIRRTVKFKLKIPYQEVLEKIDNKEKQEMEEKFKIENFVFNENLCGFAR